MATILKITNKARTQELLITHMKKYKYKPVFVKKVDNILNQFCDINPEVVIIDEMFLRFNALYWLVVYLCYSLL
ncbi:hypothetical protein COC60_06540 [Bacillus thuringiensis]|uniref:Uncharacterized protein n=1 Tax=Bacillus thuringiensis TaxID=1428 RepID=A0ABD6SJA1_BACTU|nr:MULTISPECIES: hypothetical protein [Bacillus]KIZ30173.1 hypothetical protein SK30_11765 [Bacillus cereus]MBJ8127395.1 hypothetical protein [Bacillus cereus]PDY98424.1 hypothetical protein CON12_19205 [Bacillus thuringiensis]PEF29437.1 hypothetical protein CON39_16705 [Bacillus thuringiensis]PES78936.1 hypothetical protein CN511_24910 [Bacillus thuringiensis]